MGSFYSEEAFREDRIPPPQYVNTRRVERTSPYQVPHEYRPAENITSEGTVNATHFHNDFYFKHDSVKFTNNSYNQYYLSFEIESSIECQVEIFFLVNETIGKNLETLQLNPVNPDGRPFPLIQTIQKGESIVIDTQKIGIPFSLPIDPKLLSADKNYYPLIILLRNPLYPLAGITSSIITSQVSYFTITSPNISPKLELIKQKIHINDHGYYLREIYGINNSEGTDCIVCLSQTRNTVIFPCRHYCLCNECCMQIRANTNICPLCRREIESSLIVNLDQ